MPRSLFGRSGRSKSSRRWGFESLEDRRVLAHLELVSEQALAGFVHAAIGSSEEIFNNVGYSNGSEEFVSYTEYPSGEPFLSSERVEVQTFQKQYNLSAKISVAAQVPSIEADGLTTTVAGTRSWTYHVVGDVGDTSETRVNLVGDIFYVTSPTAFNVSSSATFSSTQFTQIKISEEIDPDTGDRVSKCATLGTAKVGDVFTINAVMNASAMSPMADNAAYETSAYSSILLSSEDLPPVTFSASAQYDAVADPETFGPYLQGVTLSNKFNIQLAGYAVSQVKKLAIIIGPKTFYATSAGGNNWTFTQDMALLPAGEVIVTVRALNAAGKSLGSHSYSVLVNNQVNFELQVDPGTGDDPIDVEKARFVKGLTPQLTFSGSIVGMPNYYNNKVFISPGPRVAKVAPTFNPSSNTSLTQTFTFTGDGSGMAVGVATSIYAIIGNRTSTALKDNLETSFAILPPAWLSSAVKSYDTATGEYVFDGAKLAQLSYKAGYVSTGSPWLDNQVKSVQASASLGAVMTIRAPLQIDEQTTFNASKLVAKLDVMDYHETRELGSESLIYSGTVAAKTLQPVSLGVKLAAPLQLGSQTFIDKTFTVNVLQVIAPSIPDKLAKAEVSLGLKVAGALTLDGGVLVNNVGGIVSYVAAGTFLKLNGVGTATATGALNVSLVKGLIEVNASVSGTITLTITAVGRFYGAVTAKPKVASVTFDARMKLDYDYSFTGSSNLKPISYNSEADGDDILAPPKSFMKLLP